MNRCHSYKDYFIPMCMGAAAAFGCGKSLSEIKACCTCEKPNNSDLKNQIYELKLRIENLEKRLLKSHET